MNRQLCWVITGLLLASAAPLLAADKSQTRQETEQHAKKSSIEIPSGPKETAYERRRKARQRLEEALAAGLGPKQRPTPREVQR